MSQTGQILQISGEAIERLAALIVEVIRLKDATAAERDAAKQEVSQLLAEKTAIETEKQQLETDDQNNAVTSQAYLNRFYELIDIAAAATAA